MINVKALIFGGKKNEILFIKKNSSKKKGELKFMCFDHTVTFFPVHYNHRKKFHPTFL